MDISFHENTDINADELNQLFKLIGWDRNDRRTESETRTMLESSLFHVHATVDDTIVGFARLIGDSYSAYVVDVITHPNFRKRKIASTCMSHVENYIRQENFISVYLLDDSGISDFYSKFGFEVISDKPMKWRGGI